MTSGSNKFIDFAHQWGVNLSHGGLHPLGGLHKSVADRVPLFKVNRGHWNRHGLIGYRWLFISDPWKPWAPMVSMDH